MGGRSSSSSASTTNNQDNRIAVQDGIGIGAGGYYANSETNTLTDARTTITNTLDGGAIAQAFGFGNNTTAGAFDFGNNTVAGALGFGNNTVNRALTTVELSNAAVGEGFTRLLDTAENLFTQNQGLIGQTQKAVADAYGQAQTDAKGTIDNRTITVLAVAGVAALFLINRGK